LFFLTPTTSGSSRRIPALAAVASAPVVTVVAAASNPSSLVSSAASAASTATAVVDKAKSTAKAVAAKTSQKSRGVLSSFLAFPKGLRAALPLLGLKKPLATSASVIRPVFAASNAVQRPSSYPSSATPAVPSMYGFPSYVRNAAQQSQHTVLPPFLGEISSAAAEGHLHHAHPAFVVPTMTHDDLAQFASTGHQQLVQLQPQIQFVPLPHPPPTHLRAPPQHPSPSAGDVTPHHPHHEIQYQPVQYHHPHSHLSVNTAGGEVDPSSQHQGRPVDPSKPQTQLQPPQQTYYSHHPHHQVVPQQESSPNQAHPNGEHAKQSPPAVVEDTEKVMYIYVDEEGKTVASQVTDAHQGPESALPDGYNIRQVGGSPPPPEAPTSIQDQGEQGQPPQAAVPPQHQAHPQPHPHEFSYTHEGHQPELVSYASDSEHPTSPAPITTTTDSGAREVIVSYPGHQQFLVKLKKKPEEQQPPQLQHHVIPLEHRPTSTPIVTAPDAIESTPSVPDSNQDMVFMLGDYHQYLKQAEAVNRPPTEFATSISDEYLPHVTEGEKPQQPPLPPHPQHSPPLPPAPTPSGVHGRPPLRTQTPTVSSSRTMTSNRGGWIPIPRGSPSHVNPPTVIPTPPSNSYPVLLERVNTNHNLHNRPVVTTTGIQEHQPSKPPSQPNSSSLIGSATPNKESPVNDEASSDDDADVKIIPDPEPLYTDVGIRTPTSPSSNRKNPSGGDNLRDAKVHFDDGDDSDSSISENSGLGSKPRITYSVSSSISAVSHISPPISVFHHNHNAHHVFHSTTSRPQLQNQESTTQRPQTITSTTSTTTTFTTEKPQDNHKKEGDSISKKKVQPAVQKRSKYNVAAVFDHEFNPIFTGGKDLGDLKEPDLIAPKGGFGLRLTTRTTRSSIESEQKKSLSVTVPSSSSSSPASTFSQRSGDLLTPQSLEESLKKPTGQYLVPIPGQDGSIKAYVVLSGETVY